MCTINGNRMAARQHVKVCFIIFYITCIIYSLFVLSLFCLSILFSFSYFLLVMYCGKPLFIILTGNFRLSATMPLYTPIHREIYTCQLRYGLKGLIGCSVLIKEPGQALPIFAKVKHLLL